MKLMKVDFSFFVLLFLFLLFVIIYIVWMCTMLEIVIGAVVVLSLISLILTIYNNKYQFAIIKLDKAEEEISLYLQRKKELLERCKPIINKELKKEDYFVELDKDLNEMNNFEVNDFLKVIYNKLFKILDENDKLFKSESLMAVVNDLSENEEKIIGAIKYYNDNVVDFNKLILSFPSSIIALFKRYKKKEFYNNEKREIFEIINKE